MRRFFVVASLTLTSMNSAFAATAKARLEPAANVICGPELVVGGNHYEHRLLGYDAPAVEAFSQNAAAYREMVAYSHGVTNSWIAFGSSVGMLALMPYMVGTLKDSQRDFARGALTTVGVGGLAYSWYLGAQARGQLLRAINTYNGVYDEKSGQVAPQSDGLRLAWAVVPQFDPAADHPWTFPLAATLSF